jgi:hypothetical protein
MKRSPLTLLVAAAALLGVAGCGSTTRVSRNGTLEVALTEYRVTPQAVDANSGLLTLVVHNYGRLTHNLVISLNGVAEVSTKPVAPVQTVEMETVLGPGRYVMASTLLSDQALGAYGTLDVSS